MASSAYADMHSLLTSQYTAPLTPSSVLEPKVSGSNGHGSEGAGCGTGESWPANAA